MTHGDTGALVLDIAILVGPDALSQDEGSGSQQGLVVQRVGEGRGSGRRREGGRAAASSNGDGDGGEAGGGGSGSSGGYDRGLGLAEKPLDGLAVGLVTELTSELEDTGGADDGHADAPATAINFAVTVLRGGLLDGESTVGGWLLPLGFQ